MNTFSQRDDLTVEAGRCRCGCGTWIGFWERNNKWKGWVKGAPKHFVKGHQHRLTADPDLRKGFRQIQIVIGVLGRPLPKGAQVHHVNKNPGDNRNCNLVICQDATYHALLHRRMKARAACGHVDWEKCKHCNVWGPSSEVIRVGVPMGYHRHCATEYRKSRPSYKWKKRVSR